jgi:hypothetical protein
VEKTSAIDGIDYIASFRPIMQEKRGNIDSTVAQPNTKEVKSIHCKRTYMT